MLRRIDLHDRLVNGSDYPLPAVSVVIRTGTLVSQGYIDAAQSELLDEIYDYNPLLFDFALKRVVHAPGGDQSFAATVFHEHPLLRASTGP
jgi:hypothetical protein